VASFGEAKMFDNLILMMGPTGTAFALISVLIALVGSQAIAKRLPGQVR
jgi:hypothetical protein